MFVIDASVNRAAYVGEIQVLRVEGTVGQLCKYKIIHPKGYSRIRIEHHYNDGWFVLLTKVVKRLEEAGYKGFAKK